MATQKAPIWQAVDKLQEQITALGLKLDEKIVGNGHAEPPKPQEPPVAPPVPLGATNNPNYFPTPQDFVDMVDLTLNKNFGIRFDPMRDAPSFLFSILVPTKYSPLKPITGPDNKMLPVDDQRVKVISNSDGVNGVRLWCEKVYSTFDSDTQFRIVEDRPFAQRQV